MSFSWQILILIFSISFFIYHLISIKTRWFFLLIISLFFLFIVSGFFGLLYTLFAVFIAYTGAYYINKNNKEEKQRKILILTVIILFTGLFLFKFTNILTPLINFISQYFNIKKNIVKNLIIPIGISYYTLILVSYVVDVYRKVTIAEKNFFKYLLSAIYFPQLMMGPIVRHNDTKEQLFSQKPIEFSYIQFGIIRILWGILKKIVIADRIALFTNQVFANYLTLPSTYVILAVFLFALQLYIDFSSAMDIVLGISECLGIKLPENFNNPYFSRNYHQFWRRWHITIFTFYRDYIFYPVIRADTIRKLKSYLEKHSKWFAKYIPVFTAYIIVFVFAGIWHGGDSRAMIGNCLLPCLYLMFADIINEPIKNIYKKYNTLQDNVFYGIFQMIGVYVLFCIAVIFFIAQSAGEGFSIILKCFSSFNIENNFEFLQMKDVIVIIFGLLFVLAVDIFKEKKIDIRNIYVNKIPIFFHWLAIFIFLIMITIFGLYGPEYNPEDFIYFKL